MKKNSFWKIGLAVIGMSMLLWACPEEEDNGKDPGNNNSNDFDIVGTYTFSQTTQGQNTLVYTWEFKEDKTYGITRSMGSTTNTGTWSVSGNNITLKDTSPQNSGLGQTINETFAITENGDQVTLSFSGSISNIFIGYFNVTGTSMTITRKDGGTGGGGTLTSVRFVSAGNRSTMAIGTDGSLWAWGGNSIGQLGDGTTTNRLTPTRIGTDTDWKSVSTGGSHTIALKADGSLWAWGENDQGQLGGGNDNRGNKSSPTRIGTETNWASVSAGHDCTIALKADGSLWAWGYNGSWILGDGIGVSFINTPTRIGTETNWASVSAGGNHYMAIKTDGSLWAWGKTGSGELGDGTNTTKTTPTRVGTETNWKSVSAGSSHTMAIKADGSLWAWGWNVYGQLGDGTTTQKLIPTQISSDINWASVSAGGISTMAIKTDGSLWAWGYNGDGLLGDGTNTTRTTPTRIGTETNWKSISKGGGSMAIKTDDSLWAWGFNGDGQLGDGTTTSRFIPTQIFIDE